jgi:S1-C subfamily serine protease
MTLSIQRQIASSLSTTLLVLAVVWSWCAVAFAVDAKPSFVAVVRDVRPKCVKLYGAGGLRGLEAYQSGVLVSADGHILTALSYVLDSDVTAVLDDGRKFDAKLVGADPLTEIAVLKIDAGTDPLPFFDLGKSATAEIGSRVLAFSNLFNIAVGDEPVSVLHGQIVAVAPLEARHGAFSANFRGDAYIVDAATNNPGSSGGALTDANGQFLGMLGKELRGEASGTWLNYALPATAFASTSQAIIDGQFKPADLTDADRPDHPLTLAALGVVLVPDVVTRTPPYVDRVLPNSPAAKAGLRPDDLVVMFDMATVTSCRDAETSIGRYEQEATVHIAVLRDEALLNFTLTSASVAPETQPDE